MVDWHQNDLRKIYSVLLYSSWFPYCLCLGYGWFEIDSYQWILLRLIDCVVSYLHNKVDWIHMILSSRAKKTIDQLEFRLSQLELLMLQVLSSQGVSFLFMNLATQWSLISIMSLEYLELVSLLNWSSVDLFCYCWCMSYL